MQIAQELDGPLVKRQMRAHLQIQMEYLNVFPEDIYMLRISINYCNESHTSEK